MITTILIVLVAVVVLIVIIAVLALHFLRADDSDTFDDVPAEPPAARRVPAGPSLEPVSDGARGRRPRHPGPPRAPGPRDQWASDRQIRPDGGRPASYRDRDTGPRPAAPDRRNGQSPGSRPAAASARPAKPAKTASADSNAQSWESLSDVDYWAELSADKPQVTPAPAAELSNGAARRGPDSKPAGRQSAEGRGPAPDGRGPAPDGRGPVPNGSLPARPRHQAARHGAGPSAGRAADPGQTEQFDARAARTGGFANEPATQSLAALARLSGAQSPAAPPPPDAGPRSAGGQRSRSGSRPAGGQRPADGQRQGHSRRPSEPAGYPRNQVPADDDPLTSPSFPAIDTSDSRSYRGRRSTSGAHAIPQTGPQQAPARAGGFAEPTTQYPVQSSGGQPQVPAVANPYGSYVSASQPTYQEAAQPRQELPGYGAGYGNGQQPDGTWHSGPVTGYLPNHGYGTADHNGNANGHNGTGHNGNGYRDQHDVQGGYGGYQDATYQGADYQPAQSMAGGYGQQNQAAGQFDERGYGVPDLAYGQDGYQGYTGYGPDSR